MITSLALVTAVAASLLAPSASAAAPTSLADPEEEASYVRTAYDGTIWEVTDGQITALTFEEWEGLGFPAWSPADTEYLKVLTLPTVYAVTYFTAAAEDTLVTPITAAEYKLAKPSVVYPAAWIDGLDLTKWATSPELIVYDPMGYTLKLTYAQWRDAGFPDYTNNTDEGFVKLSWDRSGSIAILCDIGLGRGGKLTYADWQQLGAPTPQAVTRVANDLVYGKRGSPNLYYYGPSAVDFLSGQLGEKLLSAADWAAMGRPAAKGYQPGYVLPALSCDDEPDASARRLEPEDSPVAGTSTKDFGVYRLQSSVDER